MHFQQLSFDEVKQVQFDADPQPTFSKIVIEQATKDQVVRHCPTCHHEERIYRRTLRPCFIPALRALIEKGPMTTTELFKHFEDKPGLAAAITRHFGEVRHWQFAKQLENGKWYPTTRAQQFLAGEIKAFRKVWPKNELLPPECKDEEAIYVSEIKAEDWGDKGWHKRESVSLPHP